MKKIKETRQEFMNPITFTMARISKLESNDVEHDEQWAHFVTVMSENAGAYAAYVLNYYIENEKQFASILKDNYDIEDAESSRNADK